MENRLTALITCKDEARNIAGCVESLRGLADEILVADSGSTDETLDIVRRLGGCRIIARDHYRYCADFKNWAIPQAEHPWILVVDADERVTPELAREIRELLAGQPDCHGYRIRFENYFLSRRIRHCGWNTTSAIRLFRSVCRYRDQKVHADVEVRSGTVGKLHGKFRHYTCTSIAQFVPKLNRYTTLWAQERCARGRRRVRPWEIALRPPLRFLQLYVYRLGFLDGLPGLILCANTAYYTLMKLVKLWELQRQPFVSEMDRAAASDETRNRLESTSKAA